MYEDFFRKVTDVRTGDGWYEVWDSSMYTDEWLNRKDK